MNSLAMAPEPILAAYIELLRRVILYVRVYSRGEERMADDQLHDLMDAVHNVPSLLMEYGRYARDETVRAELMRYDENWGAKGRHAFSLIAIVDEQTGGC